MAADTAVRAIVSFAIVAATAAPAFAEKPKPVTPANAVADSYDAAFEKYLQQARAMPAATAPGSWNWMNGLNNDRRAHGVNDLITIQVVENLSASGSADAALGKQSDASHSLPALLGLEKKLPSAIDPTALVGLKSDTNFKGSGTTNRAGVLTALLTARVAEVLPSGDLVVEGVREIEINGDLQVVVLSGVVRPTDVTTNNVVQSTSIGQLRIRYFGRGLMKDNLKPGFLVRMLNKVF